MTAVPVDSLDLWDRLAAAMATEPERYERLGDIDLELAIVMRRAVGNEFRLRLSFHGITCDGVALIEAGDESAADCWLEGDVEDWQAMFDNVAEHGHAVDQWTLNTLTLFGDRIRLRSSDPMGADRFHRFNQTLQDFIDASARLTAPA